MGRVWPNDQLRAKYERQVTALARAMVSGEERVVTGSLRMSTLLRWLGVPEDDPDFLAMSGVCSETTHLPLGGERLHWDPAALADKDREIEAVEEWAKAFAQAACERLAVRFPAHR